MARMGAVRDIENGRKYGLGLDGNAYHISRLEIEYRFIFDYEIGVVIACAVWPGPAILDLWKPISPRANPSRDFITVRCQFYYGGFNSFEFRIPSHYE